METISKAVSRNILWVVKRCVMCGQMLDLVFVYIMLKAHYIFLKSITYWY